MDNEHVQKLQHYFAESENIVFAILFGSQAAGKATPMSDVDIAVFTKEPITLLERGGLITRLEMIVQTPVDCIVLNDLAYAAPMLAFDVIANGSMLICKDFDAFVAYKVKVIHAHADFAPTHERLMTELFHRIENGTFGKISDERKIIAS
jgi:predicted nucleotidyltransferase